MKELLCFFITLFVSSHARAVPAQGHRIMYAGASPYSVEIARDISLKGGNVVDVAVAVAIAQAVTHPYFSSLGGGGFALVKIGGNVEALDFREVAPLKTHPKTFTDQTNSRDGGLAVAVPGNPAGFWELHKRYGRLPWRVLVDRAIQLAEKGFRVSGEWASTTSRNEARFNEAGRRNFFMQTPGGRRALLPGDLLKQPALAKFLHQFQTQGPKAFYMGDGAKDLVETIQSSGGVIALDDLKGYKPRWLKPLTTDFEGYHLSLMPPPSAGGIVIAQGVKLMEKLNLKSYAALSVDEFHLLAEIMKMSFKSRRQFGDPDFAQNPIDGLLTDQAISELASKIKLDKVAPVENEIPQNKESTQTTHFTVMDANGDCVAITETLNGDYGSGVVTQKTGIALNNEMDDFTTKPGKPNMFGLIQGDANLVRAGARPLSSMSPTIVEKDGKTVFAIGAPGGPRITTAVLQVLYRLMTQKFNIDQAIQAPRIHHQYLPDITRVDPFKFSPEIITGLEKRGHKIQLSPVGKVYGVLLGKDGILNGAADGRGEGAAGGY